MNVLHLDSSILGDHSVSRALSAAVVARLKSAHPHLHVTYRDLAANPVPHLSGAYLAAAQSPAAAHAPEIQHDLALGTTLLDELFAADIIVIGAGLYNFTVPSQLKTWIDRIAVAGKTFYYTEKGPEGLLGGKRVILALGRGGLYGPGTPFHSFEHGESYVRALFGFLGVTDFETILAEGVAYGPDQREAALKSAHEQIATLPAAA